MSFNFHGNENANEVENVPAFMRRKGNLENDNAASESFLSGYSVEDNDNNKGYINTINTFLDGKRPD
jgi:cell division protein FtsZ